APVVRDTRTATEKAKQQAEDQFAVDFGDTVQPVQRKVTFQVVGLSPDDTTDTTSFFGLLGSVTGSSLGGGYVIPDNLFEETNGRDELAKILLDYQDPLVGTPKPVYTVEFASAQDAKRFIDDKSCTTRPEGTCASPGRLFDLTAYGNNSIALQSAGDKVTQVLELLSIGVMIFAVVIMTTIVGRVVADSRKESAIFRALGARRADIAAIYISYAMIFIVLVALILGLGVAWLVGTYYDDGTTVQAKLLFDAVNANLHVDLFRIDVLQLVRIVIAIVAVGIVSTVVPLMHSIRRNPINDLREE
ncbi:MAG TPA: ABC transporter permease, partial [Candidatus Saccharimonadaceae bacterium]|nr:ABC transporter permease [Candidatus Saccharimonadaceae bacterium]